jgi:signal transduction histidine kinase
MPVLDLQAKEPRLGNHWVAFYDDDAELCTPLSEFVRAGVQRGDGIIVLATPEHRRSVSAELGTPLLDDLRHRGSYREIDAADTIDGISQGHALSEALFSNLVSTEVTRARRASRSGDVRVFGEAVGMLTAAGRFDAALELEEFWNRIMMQHELALFCAYPLAHFRTALERAKLETICLSHTHVETRRPPSAVFDDQRAALEEELSLCKAELEQARRLEAIALLGGGIAHDFNNFLTVINSATDYLLDMYLPDDEPRRSLLDIRAASERASALSARLLALSGSQHHQPRIVDPNEIVRGLSRLLQQVVRQQAELSLELDEALGCVQVDSGQIEQVLLNLVVNARDAISGEGRIVLRTRKHERTVAIEVSDNGSGIADSVKARLFEPYFTTKEHGFGLGLSTVHALVQQNGGQVSVSSVPGQGTTFRLLFPEVSGAAPEPAT